MNIIGKLYQHQVGKVNTSNCSICGKPGAWLLGLYVMAKRIYTCDACEKMIVEFIKSLMEAQHAA